jgi:hypothetical protein
MVCRVCGHRNTHSRGSCANCGYDLDYQTLPLDEQRSGLSERLEKPVSFEERMPMRAHPRSKAGYFGAFLALAGFALAVYIVTNHERAVLEATPPPDLLALQDQSNLPSDSLPLQIGSDIIYVLSVDGGSAIPRTNLDLQLIPEGSTAAALCHKSVPYNSLVVFIERKLLEFKGVVSMEKLCCWDDTSEASYTTIPLVDPPDEADTLNQPVVLKFIVMEEWLVGRIDEYNIDVTAPVRSGFNQSKFDSLLYQVNRRVLNRDIGDREVHVWAMFPEDAVVGDVIDVLAETGPQFDSLGYRTFRLKYFRPE